MAFLHGKSYGVLFNEYDLASYFNSADSSQTLETAETTTFGASAKTYVPGLLDGTVSLSGLFDGAAGAVDAVLQSALGASGAKVLSLAPAGFGTLGNRALLASVRTTDYSTSAPVSDVVSCSAELQCSGGLWGGVVLGALGALTATANGAAHDNGAASTNGYVANLHVTAVSGTNPTNTAKVQHSTDNSVWADLCTFAAATAITAEQVTGTGTVNRYTRVVDTIGGTNPSFTRAVTLSRK